MVKLDFFGSGGDPKPEAEAQRLLKDGNHLAAGKLLEDAGRLSQAVDAYLAGNEWIAAARVSLAFLTEPSLLATKMERWVKKAYFGG